jgi:hypothetical protein
MTKQRAGLGGKSQNRLTLGGAAMTVSLSHGYEFVRSIDFPRHAPHELPVYDSDGGHAPPRQGVQLVLYPLSKQGQCLSSKGTAVSR